VYSVVITELAERDLWAAKRVIDSYFLEIGLFDKAEVFKEQLEADFAALCDNLRENPYSSEAYRFKPPIETKRDCRTRRIGWFTVFWWTDEDAKVCHIVRVLSSKSDFTKVNTW
jgi:hypothetical protein